MTSFSSAAGIPAHWSCSRSSLKARNEFQREILFTGIDPGQARKLDNSAYIPPTSEFQSCVPRSQSLAIQWTETPQVANFLCPLADPSVSYSPAKKGLIPLSLRHASTDL